MPVTRAAARVAVTVMTVSLVVAMAGAAQAGPDDTSTPDAPTYETSVRVKLEGTATPPPGQAPVDPPPPVCWWEPAGALADNPTEFAEAFRASANSFGTADMIERQYMQLQNGSASLDEAVEAEATTDPPGVTWYMLKWDSTLLEGEDYYAALEEAGCTTFKSWRGDSRVAVMYRFFTPGNEPPPQVDVEELARYAYRAMTLVPPGLDWNPKIEDSGNAALVNLPTWLWMQNPLSVAEDRFIRASIGSVWARVDAKPNGVEIEAPGQSVTCTNAQVRRAYASGRDERSACTLTFDKASYDESDGFEVTATTTWAATWTSSTGEGGDFDPRIVWQTTSVPVISSQAIVRGVE